MTGIGVTAMVITFNEKENIGRSIQQLAWVSELLIIDSGSTDGTLEIARSVNPQVRILTRPFDSFAGQCNFGLSQIQTEWVLSLDADYILTPQLISEIGALDEVTDNAGYNVEFNYCIFGRRLRSTLYPARKVLYRRRLARYHDEGHGHRVMVDGKIDRLSGRIDHDDRKPLTQWLQSQDRYARIEAKHLLSQPVEQLMPQDRLRLRIYVAPVIMPFYLLFWRRLGFDRWQGWFYVGQRTIAEFLLSLRLLTERERLER